MFNNEFRYRQNYNEAMAEDAQGLNKFIQEEREKAYNSYPEGEEVKLCSICGEPLRYVSNSYDEGFHIDNCV